MVDRSQISIRIQRLRGDAWQLIKDIAALIWQSVAVFTRKCRARLNRCTCARQMTNLMWAAAICISITSYLMAYPDTNMCTLQAETLIANNTRMAQREIEHQMAELRDMMRLIAALAAEAKGSAWATERNLETAKNTVKETRDMTSATKTRLEAQMEGLRAGLADVTALTAEAKVEVYAANERARVAKTIVTEAREIIAAAEKMIKNRAEIILNVGSGDPFIESVSNGTKDMIFIRETAICNLFKNYVGRVVTLRTHTRPPSSYDAGHITIKNVQIREVINVTLPADLINDVERSCTPCGGDWESIRNQLPIAAHRHVQAIHCNFKETSKIYEYFDHGSAADTLECIAPLVLRPKNTNQCGSLIIAPHRFSYIFDAEVQLADSKFKIESSQLYRSSGYLPNCFVKIALA